MERDLILKALTNPEFRRTLEENTADVDEYTRDQVLAAVKGINSLVAAAADLILCMPPPDTPAIC